MNDMTLDLNTATLDDLDNLSINDILGEDISKISLNQGLPNGLYMVVIDDYELKSMAADVEKDKKARRDLNLKLKVVKALALEDGTLDAASFTGRVHFERYNLLADYGKINFIKFLLGIFGVKFTDKKAIAEVNDSPALLLETLKVEKIPFGVTMKNVERNGYENCNVELKEAKFIDASKAQDYLD